MTTYKGITFNAQFKALRSLIDGGWSVSFDVSQDEAQNLLELSKYRDRILSIAIIPSPTFEEQHDRHNSSSKSEST